MDDNIKVDLNEIAGNLNFEMGKQGTVTLRLALAKAGVEVVFI